MLPAGDGVAHNDLIPRDSLDEDTTMAAIDHNPSRGVVAEAESLRRDAVGRVQQRCEGEGVAQMEDAEERRLPVVRVEAAEELAVGDDASPAPADGGCAREGGRLWREAEEDLPEHIVVVLQRQRQGGRRLRRGAAVAGHPLALAGRVDLWMQARAASAAGHSGAALAMCGILDLGAPARAAWEGKLGALLARVDPGTEARAAAAAGVEVAHGGAGRGRPS